MYYYGSYWKMKKKKKEAIREIKTCKRGKDFTVINYFDQFLLILESQGRFISQGIWNMLVCFLSLQFRTIIYSSGAFEIKPNH